MYPPMRRGKTCLTNTSDCCASTFRLLIECIRYTRHVPHLSVSARCEAFENFASTVSRDHALFDADASRSYPAFSLFFLRIRPPPRSLLFPYRTVVLGLPNEPNSA